MQFTLRTAIPLPIYCISTFHSQQVYRTNSVLKPLGKKSNPIQSVTLSLNLAKEFLRDALTAKQLRIEIWVPEGGKKSATRFVLSRQVSQSIGSGYELKVTNLQASPGNLQAVEDLLFSHDSDNDATAPPIVLAIRVSTLDGIRTVGTASADASIRTIGIAQFAETDLFSNLEVCGFLVF